MICSNCNTPNEEGAKFCKNCGAQLYPVIESKPDNKVSDILIFTFIFIAFIANIAQFAIQKLVTNWYEGPTRYIQSGIWILQNLCFILIAIAIRNKSLKIVAVIITAILVIYWLYTNIEFMLKK
ncbi:MAG TPA: zinc ribbon domain-containing protein [Ginsengibacter sp.]